MLNVQALTRTLSSMSLPQLQQYATLHKNDPYVVTMALSIANQKKQAMMAQQGMAGQQPMPKVVDQEIAQVAPRAAPMPEEVGIAQLPAKNIQNMAGGGIVAFGDGGDVPRYADGKEVVDMPEWVRRLPPDALLRRYFEQRALGKPLLDIQPPQPASAQPAQPAMPMGSNLGATDASLGAAGEAAVARTAPPAPAPVVKTEPQVRPAPVPRAAAPQAGVPNLITDAAGMQKALGQMQAGVKPEVPEVISGGISDLQKTEQAAADKMVADIKAEQAARPLAFKDFEARLKEREGRLSKSEEQLGPLALLQAGLSIMSGTSPFAAVNIGAGAQVGVKAYTEGADKLERAREKMDESFAKIEEIRRNESRMDAKELRDAQQAAMKPAIDAKRLTLSALEKDWGLQRQEALKGLEAIMSNQRTMYEQAEATKRTGMQIAAQRETAAMPTGEARTAMMLGTGKTDAERLESGMKRLQEITADKSGMAAVKLLTEVNAKREANMQPPLTMDDLLRSAREYSALMYPKVADVQNTRARP